MVLAVALIGVDASVGPFPELQRFEGLIQLSRLQELFEPHPALVCHQDVLNVICPSVEVLGSNVGGTGNTGGHPEKL